MGEGRGAAAAAKSWLESLVTPVKGMGVDEMLKGNHPFDAPSMSELVMSQIEAGRILCTLRVPAHLADADGNWQSGAIATLIDDVGAAAIMTTEGLVKISVDFDITFFSPTKIHEEVEIDAHVVGHKGKKKKLSAVLVEIRKKGSGEMVALGRQWMSAALPTELRSKL